MSYIVREGNLAAAPELREGAKSGTKYTYARVIVTDRIRTAEGEFVDGAAVAYNLTVFGAQAEQLVDAANASGNIKLVFAGDYTVRSYTSREGESRVSHDVRVDVIGVSLRGQEVRAQSLRALRENDAPVPSSDPAAYWGSPDPA